jgi:phosphoribosyl 1,2-cyclic phosphodiesterase
VGDAIALATKYGVRSLILFHHGPQRTDHELTRIERELNAPIHVRVAREGEVLDVATLCDSSSADRQ